MLGDLVAQHEQTHVGTSLVGVLIRRALGDVQAPDGPAIFPVQNPCTV
jgi:hypothetical protein